jgi:hypothetical protein
MHKSTGSKPRFGGVHRLAALSQFVGALVLVLGVLAGGTLSLPGNGGNLALALLAGVAGVAVGLLLMPAGTRSGAWAAALMLLATLIATAVLAAC